jgi:peptidoglycan/xylan/chitin deacetylase (PgdA/CDA1 family)
MKNALKHKLIEYCVPRVFKKGPIVLGYHGIEDKILNPIIQEVQLPTSIFEKQIKYLKTHFDIISMDYLYECLANNYKLNPRNIIITFDDGYKNNLYIAAPILSAYEIPFTVFLTTKNIDENLRFDSYIVRTAILYSLKKYVKVPSIKKELVLNNPNNRFQAQKYLLEIMKQAPQINVNQIKNAILELLSSKKRQKIDDEFYSNAPLNWNEVKKLQKLGATIGSHCHEHICLHKNQSLIETQFQLKKSKDLIEQNTGRCDYFSFPYGKHNDICKVSHNEVKNCGYSLGFSAINGFITEKYSPFILPRIFPSDDMDLFRASLNRIKKNDNNFKRWNNSLC